jgi:hypothetical protein
MHLIPLSFIVQHGADTVYLSIGLARRLQRKTSIASASETLVYDRLAEAKTL